MIEIDGLFFKLPEIYVKWKVIAVPEDTIIWVYYFE